VTPGILDGYRWVGSRLANPKGAKPTIGHRDTKATECPGNSLYASLPKIQPPFTQEDDMSKETVAEGVELAVQAKPRGRARDDFKSLIIGSGGDALRERDDAHPDRGAWRGLVAEISEEAAERAIRRVLAEAGLIPPTR
jgi:hypothetical protein